MQLYWIYPGHCSRITCVNARSAVFELTFHPWQSEFCEQRLTYVSVHGRFNQGEQQTTAAHAAASFIFTHFMCVYCFLFLYLWENSQVLSSYSHTFVDKQCWKVSQCVFVFWWVVYLYVKVSSKRVLPNTQEWVHECVCVFSLCIFNHGKSHVCVGPSAKWYWSVRFTISHVHVNNVAAPPRGIFGKSRGLDFSLIKESHSLVKKSTSLQSNIRPKEEWKTSSMLIVLLLPYPPSVIMIVALWVYDDVTAQNELWKRTCTTMWCLHTRTVT